MLVEVIFFNILYGTPTLLISSIMLILVLIYIQMLGNLRKTNSSSDFPFIFSIFFVMSKIEQSQLFLCQLSTGGKMLTLNVANKQERSIYKTLLFLIILCFRLFTKLSLLIEFLEKWNRSISSWQAILIAQGINVLRKEINLDSIFNSGKTTILQIFKDPTS